LLLSSSALQQQFFFVVVGSDGNPGLYEQRNAAAAKALQVPRTYNISLLGMPREREKERPEN
jgi:hypothetical protein